MTTLPADQLRAAAHDHHHDHHHEIGFIRKYLFSMDHKVIGIQFLFTALLLMVIGGGLALAVRWQIAWPFDPAQPMPLLGKLHFSPATQSSTVPGDVYNMLFTMHATFMIFFVIIPLLVGAFGNVLIPLMIGARDMAFPLLNMLSYWVTLAGGIVMIASFYYGGAQAGWTSYPTLSTSTFSPSLAQSLWVISLLIIGGSSLMGAINYITTILNMRCPGMTLFRMPLTVWALFVTSILIAMSTPVLTSALLMLLFDRHFGTHFFSISDQVRAGTMVSTLDSGQPLLYQHLFWFYSHPAVYIMILPAMGIASDILATFCRKPIFGYKPMVFAIGAIAFLGFIVWGHHMFASGMNPILGTTFMASTVMIALPSAIKTFNWLGTMWGGQIRFTPAMLYALGFVSMFVIGGLSGIFMACAPVDLYFHDTYFIVGHIHYVLFGGSMFGIFGGIYYWYPKMFGRNLNEGLGKLHFWLTLVSFNITFFLMHIIGIGGHPRRIATILEYPSMEHLQPLNIAMTVGALMLGLAQLIFVVNIFCSLGRFGNRILLYPLILVGLEWAFGFVSAIMGFEGVPMAGRIVLLLIVLTAMGIVDGLIVSALRVSWDKPINPILGVLCWVTALPLFAYPVFARGDFWEWIGVNSTTYGITGSDYIGASMQPFPTAVDPDQLEVIPELRFDVPDRADDSVMLPTVTSVLVNYTKLAQGANEAGISIEQSSLAATLESRDEYGFISVPVATIAGLDGQLKPLVEKHRVMVSLTNGTVERINLMPNHKVSRTWSSKKAETNPEAIRIRIVEWNGVSTGWVLVALTGVLGIGLAFVNRRRLSMGDPVGSNPWNANSLEWCATSPPWYENFPEIPTVHRGPYEFSSPAVEEDYLPQWVELPEGVEEPTGH